MTLYHVNLKKDSRNFVYSEPMPEFEARRFIADWIMGTVEPGVPTHIEVKLIPVLVADKTPKQLYDEKFEQPTQKGGE